MKVGSIIMENQTIIPTTAALPGLFAFAEMATQFDCLVAANSRAEAWEGVDPNSKSPAAVEFIHVGEVLSPAKDGEQGRNYLFVIAPPAGGWPEDAEAADEALWERAEAAEGQLAELGWGVHWEQEFIGPLLWVGTSADTER